MFGKDIYSAAIASLCSVSFLFAAIDRVEVKVQLQVGDKVKESTVIVDSESYTQLSMENEALGFALKLVDATEGNQRIETAPTHNKKHIVNFIRTGQSARFGAGCNVNGHKFEKDLAVRFLNIKKIS